MTKMVRIALSLAILSTLMIIPALPSSGAEPPDFPACPLAEGIVLENGEDWGPDYLTAHQATAQAVFGPVAIELVPGDYDITLVSFDEHDKPDDQPKEQWFVEVFNDGESSFVSSPIADLPTGDQVIVEKVASHVHLEGDSITLNHFAFKDPNDNPQSIYALCAAFERIGFIDDDGSIFESDIEWMFSKGYTKGCNPPDNDKYCPNNIVTRGQMAAFLTRALGLTETSGENTFTDDDTSIFEADIEKLAFAGITKGCNPAEGNTKFCPESYVTRGQMAAFLVRAMKYTDVGDGDLFIDDDDSIFENDIDKLGTAGVTKGCNPAEGNTKFCPDNFVTRGQMAAFLRRALS